MAEPKLGINITDYIVLTENVNIVLNGAASIRFDLYIKDALNINTFGCKRLLDLCTQFKQLKVNLLYIFFYFTEDIPNILCSSLCTLRVLSIFQQPIQIQMKIMSENKCTLL